MIKRQGIRTKFKIVISDLHLGAGHEAEGNRLEDFNSDREFASFLAEVALESKSQNADVELIINGDAFEMLQVPHVESFEPGQVYPPITYHSSSEVDSVRKMAHIIAGHRLFFEALGRFVRIGPPRRYVTIVKGNHDLNLHWRAVQDQIRQAMAATGARESLATFVERRISREGIYVEHGNQYGEMVDRVKDMEEPHDPDRPGQLALPPGSWLVMDVFNQVERERYWIDGVKPVTALVWYALAYDFPFAVRVLAALLRALPGVVREGLLDAQDARAELVRQLEDPGQAEQLATRYYREELFRVQFHTALARVLCPPPSLSGGESMPLTAVSDPVAMGDQIRGRVNVMLYDAAARRAIEEGAQVVIFGHAHDPGVESLPNGGVYLNSGTWTWRGDFSQAGPQSWRELFEHPERFTMQRQLPYVRVDYNEAGRPSARLLVYQPPWVQKTGPTHRRMRWPFGAESSQAWWWKVKEWFLSRG